MTEITISSPHFIAADDSVLLTDSNFKQYLGDSRVFHTSLADISASNLLKIAKFDCKFIFVNNGFDNDAELFEKTKIFLNSIYDTHIVIGYIRPGPMTFAEQSIVRSDCPTLWIFGCSLSVGVGVSNNDLYSTKLGDSLGMPVVTVAKGGSSTRWSLRQLMHADIRPEDIVIWQLTTLERFTVKQENKWPQEVMLKNLSRAVILATTDEQLWFDQISLINYGVQYLRACNSNFYMISLDGQTPMIHRCLEQYTRYPEYCYGADWQVEIGTDGLHPGPKSHNLLYQILKEKILLAQRH
jgi:hypothetical protein